MLRNFNRLNFLMFLLISCTNTQPSLMTQAPKLATNFTPTQVAKFLPMLQAHQEKTRTFWNRFSPKDHPFVQPEFHPNIVFPYLLLCAKLNIKTLPMISYAEEYASNFSIFLDTNCNKFEQVGISTKTHRLPHSKNYLDLLEIVQASPHQHPLPNHHVIKIVNRSINQITCPVCLNLQNAFNDNDAKSPMFQAQRRSAIHLCTAHKFYDTNKLENLLQEFKQEKEQVRDPWHQNISLEMVELMIQIRDADNSMGEIINRIPNHLMPSDFV